MDRNNIKIRRYDAAGASSNWSVGPVKLERRKPASDKTKSIGVTSTRNRNPCICYKCLDVTSSMNFTVSSYTTATEEICSSKSCSCSTTTTSLSQDLAACDTCTCLAFPTQPIMPFEKSANSQIFHKTATAMGDAAFLAKKPIKPIPPCSRVTTAVPRYICTVCPVQTLKLPTPDAGRCSQSKAVTPGPKRSFKEEAAGDDRFFQSEKSTKSVCKCPSCGCKCFTDTNIQTKSCKCSFCDDREMLKADLFKTPVPCDCKECACSPCADDKKRKQMEEALEAKKNAPKQDCRCIIDKCSCLVRPDGTKPGKKQRTNFVDGFSQKEKNEDCGCTECPDITKRGKKAKTSAEKCNPDCRCKSTSVTSKLEKMEQNVGSGNIVCANEDCSCQFCPDNTKRNSKKAQKTESANIECKNDDCSCVECPDITKRSKKIGSSKDKARSSSYAAKQVKKEQCVGDGDILSKNEDCSCQVSRDVTKPAGTKGAAPSVECKNEYCCCADCPDAGRRAKNMKKSEKSVGGGDVLCKNEDCGCQVSRDVSKQGATKMSKSENQTVQYNNDGCSCTECPDVTKRGNNKQGGAVCENDVCSCTECPDVTKRGSNKKTGAVCDNDVCSCTECPDVTKRGNNKKDGAVCENDDCSCTECPDVTKRGNNKKDETVCDNDDCSCPECPDVTKRGNNKKGGAVCDNDLCSCTECPDVTKRGNNKKDGAVCENDDCSCPECIDVTKRGNNKKDGAVCENDDCSCPECIDVTKRGNNKKGGAVCDNDDCKCEACPDVTKQGKNVKTVGGVAVDCPNDDCCCFQCLDPNKGAKGSRKIECKSVMCQCDPCGDSACADKRSKTRSPTNDCICDPSKDLKTPSKKSNKETQDIQQLPCQCKKCICDPCADPNPGKAAAVGGTADEKNCYCSNCSCKPCPIRSTGKGGDGNECFCAKCICEDPSGKVVSAQGDVKCICDSCVCPDTDAQPIAAPARTCVCTCVNCNCECSKKAASGEQVPCDCPTCICDPCADANVAAKGVGQKNSCHCAKCTCVSDEGLKKAAANSCHCQLCTCPSDTEPVMTSLPCNCDECQCTPCQDPSKSSPLQAAKGDDDCVCQQCICPSEPELPDPNCPCTPCSDAKCETKITDKSTHDRDCICTDCLCDELQKIPTIELQTQSNKTNQQLAPDSCICQTCECPDEEDDEETCICESCSCPKCSCRECNCNFDKRDKKPCRCRGKGAKPPEAPGAKTGCRCKPCSCVDCFFEQQATRIENKVCKCAPCSCIDCIYKVKQEDAEELCHCTACSCVDCLYGNAKIKDICKCTPCSCIDCLVGGSANAQDDKCDSKTKIEFKCTCPQLASNGAKSGGKGDTAARPQSGSSKRGGNDCVAFYCHGVEYNHATTFRKRQEPYHWESLAKLKRPKLVEIQKARDASPAFCRRLAKRSRSDKDDKVTAQSDVFLPHPVSNQTVESIFNQTARGAKKPQAHSDKGNNLRLERCKYKEQIKIIKKALKKIKSSKENEQRQRCARANEAEPLLKKHSDFVQTLSELGVAFNYLKQNCRANDKVIKAITEELRRYTSSTTFLNIFNKNDPDATSSDRIDDVQPPLLKKSSHNGYSTLRTSVPTIPSLLPEKASTRPSSAAPGQHRAGQVCNCPVCIGPSADFNCHSGDTMKTTQSKIVRTINYELPASAPSKAYPMTHNFSLTSEEGSKEECGYYLPLASSDKKDGDRRKTLDSVATSHRGLAGNRGVMSNKIKTPMVKRANSLFGQTVSDLRVAITTLQAKCKAKDKIIDKATRKLKEHISSKALLKVMNNYVDEAPDYDPLRETKTRSLAKEESLLARQQKLKGLVPCKCGTYHNDNRHVNLEGFRVVNIKRITIDSIIVEWKAPKSKAVTGYEIEINQQVKSKIMSGWRTCAMIHSLDLSKVQNISIFARTICGRCEPPARAIYEIKNKRHHPRST